MKKLLYFIVAIATFTSCSTSKKTTADKTPPPSPPENVEFKTFTNTSGFAKINFPMKDDKYNFKSEERNGKLPSLQYNSSHITIQASFSDKVGTFSEMFEILKPKYAINNDDKTTCTIKEMKIGDKEVALITSIKTNRNKTETHSYGYMMKNGDKMGVIMMYMANLNPNNQTQIASRISLLDETFRYMIHTLEFE